MSFVLFGIFSGYSGISQVEINRVSFDGSNRIFRAYIKELYQVSNKLSQISSQVNNRPELDRRVKH